MRPADPPLNHNLDLTQIEDIKIEHDNADITLPNLAPERLIKTFEKAKRDTAIEPSKKK